MKKIFFLLFVFSGAIAKAQPSFDTVSKGIHTITEKICGYKYGDSTGLVLDKISEYNMHGQLTKRVCRDRISQEMIVERDREEPEAISWFYDDVENGNYKIEAKAFDTSRYQYDSKSRLVKYTSRDYQGKVIRHIYSYDVNGNCISDVFLRNGKEEFRREWKYNAHNEVVTETRTDAGQPAEKMMAYYYDEQNRLLAQKNYNRYYNDSTVWSYLEEGKIKTVYRASGSFVREVYNAKDSLVSSAEYLNNTARKGEVKLSLFDSTFITRNDAGFSVSSRTVTNYSETKEIVTRDFDAKGRCLEELLVSNDKKIRRMVYTYDDERRIISESRYGFHYEKNALGDDGKEVLKEQDFCFYDKTNHLAEKRVFNGHGQLLERIVYTYTRY